MQARMRASYGRDDCLYIEPAWFNAIVPAKAGTHNQHCILAKNVLDQRVSRRDSAAWVPAFAGTTCGEIAPQG
jgi:hypothetical protein